MSELPRGLRLNLKPPHIEPENALVGAALRVWARAPFLLVMRLAWGALILLTLAVFFLTLQARHSQLVILGNSNSIALSLVGLPTNFFALYIGAMDALIFVGYILVGGLIFLRKSQEWIGLFASLTLITSGVIITRPGDALLFVAPSVQLPLMVTFAVGLVAITIFVYIFPDGRFRPRWLVLPVLAWVAFDLYSSLGEWLIAEPHPWPPQRISPIAVLGIVGGAAVQIYRFRRVSTPAERQQTRLVVAGLVTAAVGLLSYLIVAPLALPAVMRPGTAQVWFLLLGVPIFYFSLLLLPLTLAVSILRYRLWNINLLLSRTLIYVPLTAILAGLFAVFESVTQELFVALTGQQSDFATVFSTLVVVAAFTPLKDLFKSIVRKRFGDATDPHTRVKQFAERINTRVTPLSAPMVTRRLVIEMVAAFNAKGGAAYLTRAGESELVHTVGAWDGEAALCIPIAVQENTPALGTVALDDRKNDAPYSDQDCRALIELGQLVARALEDDRAAAQT